MNEPRESERYVVHFHLDNVARTPGRCWSDHRLEPGELLDVRDERAIVYSCFLVKVVAPRRATNQGDRRVT